MVPAKGATVLAEKGYKVAGAEQSRLPWGERAGIEP